MEHLWQSTTSLDGHSSQRGVPRPEATLVDGVPDYLAGPLMRWLDSYLRGRPKLTERIALQLHVAVDDQDAERFAAGLRTDDPALLLDAIDVALHLDKSFWWTWDAGGPIPNMEEASLASWIPEAVWPKDSRAREVERLDELLEDAGSDLLSTGKSAAFVGASQPASSSRRNRQCQQIQAGICAMLWRLSTVDTPILPKLTMRPYERSRLLLIPPRITEGQARDSRQGLATFRGRCR